MKIFPESPYSPELTDVTYINTSIVLNSYKDDG